MDLFLDVETYSSVDLKKCGVYKYVASPDFEVLIIAYAFGSDPVQVVDVGNGEPIPTHLIKALRDPEVIKHAHNAAFERQAFKAVGFDIPIRSWRCSAVKASYCGLPSSLDMVSKALKLTNEKLSSGKALIDFFSIPCRPTDANGKRRRNLPEHAPQKWADFKDYCLRDVEAEREILQLLKGYTIPTFEQEGYFVDQEINDTGILIDIVLAENARAIDSKSALKMRSELKKLTGLENPNSPKQLKEWLTVAMKKEITTLAKGELETLKDCDISEPVRDVLDLRSRSSKTSIKKYIAMLSCAGDDLRARGLFSYYGANKTGRWAGRLIQLQNLPRNKFEGEELDDLREAVLNKDLDFLNLERFGGVSNILSQLIRTALVAAPGNTFAVSDFSAIEARVIAWVAGETWRLDVFNTHGKIYEASASMMFGVPIEEITKGSDLRQKGKIAELALGYQGGVGALITMGGEKMGLDQSTMKGIVDLWRRANPNIVNLWKVVQTKAILAIENPFKVIKGTVAGLEFMADNKNLTIKLPSGRSLFYHNPRIGLNKWGSKSIVFWGVDQTTKQWCKMDTYGGKLVENIIQAIARDVLLEAIFRLKDKYKIVMHVHDEIVAEVPKKGAEEALESMELEMGRPVTWAPGLPLAADGYLTNYYKKD